VAGPEAARPSVVTTFGDLFAGIAVSEFGRAREWYERLLGTEPSFLPHETEAVWEVAEHRFVYIVERADDAGHAASMLFAEDLDALLEGIADRGIHPVAEEVHEGSVRKVIFRDPDGNEIAFGGTAG
jgi:catechol 2,3-dioxygenase-like lactoylglutathione lyase family enzyme